MQVVDLARLNSATKYPSIETYHALDPKTGCLGEPAMEFEGDVVLTEKVDGANARIIVMPDGDWFLGSREELFHARGDRVWVTQLAIVDTLQELATRGQTPDDQHVLTFYLEVYGHGIGGSSKQYTTQKETGYRLFDLSLVPLNILDMDRGRISSWREHGGQLFAHEEMLRQVSEDEGIPLAPRIGTQRGEDLPKTLEETFAWLSNLLPSTQAALNDSGKGDGEGIVIRSAHRQAIAKARFQDYSRTFRKLEHAGR